MKPRNVESNCDDVVIRTTPPDGRTDTDKAVVSIIAPPLYADNLVGVS